ncbi:hypothetical protein AB6A40_009414 [Gnathostoma spinigerum]|uniref:Peptidase S26 domain-containing protein n=1 Tax=Gnathostoma spinigerum TaxID=75299 RepID=A0ABD6ET54_9BILA
MPGGTSKLWRLQTYFNLRNARCVLYAFGICHVIGQYIGEIVVCSGPSMTPTIIDGDIVIAERMSVAMGNLRRGDIVCCFSPQNPRQLLCKRLTKMEHDEVSYDSDWAMIRRIPKGHIFLEGDNTFLSTDSREFGPLPMGLVQIRIVMRIWPLSRAGWLSSHWFWK